MPGTAYAILIGNSLFPNEPLLPTLRCPVNDVHSMRDVLAAEKHGPYEVQVLENWEHHAIQLAILRTLKRANYEDKVLIYYAGHGKINNDDSALYLAAANTNVNYLAASSVSVAEITRQMKYCASKQLILVLDCCYSGAIDKFMSPDTVFRGDAAEQVGMNFRNSLGSGTYVLTACSSLQRAAELEGDSNGLLTKHLVLGIREGLADRNDDGLISMHELTTYVQEQVKREGDQTPSYFSFREEDGGLVIAKSGKPARSRKIFEVQDAIYHAALERRASFRTTRSALALLLPDPSATPALRALCNDFVDRLHTHLADPQAMMEILEEAHPLSLNLLVLPASVRQEIEQQRDAARAEVATLQAALDAALNQIQQVEQSLRSANNEAARLVKEQGEVSGNAERYLQQCAMLRADIKKLNKDLTLARGQKEKATAECRTATEQWTQLRQRMETMQQDRERDQESLRKAQEDAARSDQALNALKKKIEQESQKAKPPSPPLSTERHPLDPALFPALKALKGTTKKSVERESAILAVLRHFEKQADFFIAPDIPPAKVAGATARLVTGQGEKILALVDCTVFGSAKNFVSFGDRQIYWYNDGVTGTITYAALRTASLAETRYGLTINGDYASLAGSSFSPGRFLALLTDLQSMPDV